MTKDELNKILKEDGMQLAIFRDGTKFRAFNITDGENGVLAKYTGIGFIWSSENTFSQRVVKALADYANTPIEERKPKPQLYNIVIAQQYDCDHDLYYVAWRKSEINDFVVDSSTLVSELNCEDYQFTQDELDLLKKELPENQKKMVDLGVTPVKPKEEGALPF